MKRDELYARFVKVEQAFLEKSDKIPITSA